MTTMAEFARTLAEEAEKRGLRIVIEPISNPIQQPISEPVKEPEIEVVTKTAAQLEKERVREERSWITVSECARMLNVSTSVIYNRVRSGIIPHRYNASGVITVSTNLLRGIPESLGGRNGVSVPIECIETGRRYKSMAHACRCLKIGIGTLQKALVDNAMVDGRHFRVIET